MAPLNKSSLLAFCITEVDTSIADIKNQMHELVIEAQNDSKSTAGDKHETGRAMMQLAQEQLGKQLHEAELKRNQLARLNANHKHDRISECSLIETNEGTLFLATPLGKVQFENRVVFVISVQSPLGKLLSGKREGETVSFNQRIISIVSIA